MLRFERPAPPDCMTAAAIAAWTAAFQKSGKIDWTRPQCRQRIKAILLETSQEHCAFCDGPLVESLETVEHFRPKRGPHGRPDLAFAWENLFPACDRCQNAKREQWHEDLLKLDAPDYHFSRYFACNYLTGEISALPAESGGDPVRANLFLQIYDLLSTKRCKCRERELRRWRRREADEILADFNYRFFLQD